MLAADDPQFADADPVKRRDKYMAYLGEAARAKKQAVREPTLRPTEGDLATVRFMGKRIEEANLLEGFHILPDSRSWSQQPWWKTKIWLRYLRGKHDDEWHEGGGAT